MLYVRLLWTPSILPPPTHPPPPNSKSGEVFRNPTLAQSMRELAEGGKKAFYEGRVGQAIVALVQAQVGGWITGGRGGCMYSCISR